MGEHIVTDEAGVERGRLTVSEDGLFAVFSYEYRGTLPLCRVAVFCGERSFSLGVPVPEGDGFTLRRRVALRDLDAAGISRVTAVKLTSGKAQPPAPRWRREAHPERLFRDRALASLAKGLTCAALDGRNGATLIAIPYTPGGDFPLPPLFKKARVADGAVLYLIKDGEVI